MNQNTVTLAGLLHDIGKLEARRQPTEPHPKLSAEWVKKHPWVAGSLGIPVDHLAEIVQRHHRDWLALPDCTPGGAGNKTLRLAAHIVAMADEAASLEEDAMGPGRHNTARLRPVVAHAKQKEPKATGNKNVVLPFVPLAPGKPFPGADAGDAAPDAATLLKAFEERCKQAQPQQDFETTLSNLVSLIDEHLWCVPLDLESPSDVALSDHLRLTAAIAGALWAFHEANDSFDLDRLNVGEQNEYVLVIGDMTGIQRHVFTALGSGVGGFAKRLRARSLEVSVLGESVARMILLGAGMPVVNRLMSAGGKFYLLLPNTEKSHAAVKATQEKFDAYLLRDLGGTLGLNLAVCKFSHEEFKDFGQSQHSVMARAHQELARKKRNPCVTLFPNGNPLLDPTKSVSLRPCRVYPSLSANPNDKDKNDPEHDGWISEQARRDKKIGQKFTTLCGLRLGDGDLGFDTPYKRFALETNGTNSGDTFDYQYRGLPNFELANHPWEFRPILGHIPCNAQDETLEFSELAEKAEGVKALGVLKMDVDCLSEIFQNAGNITRTVGLSRSLEWFFTVEVKAIIEKNNWQVYTVFSGGDDLFVIGPWNEILEFAAVLYARWREFTACNENMTLSAGYVQCSPSLPIPILARAAEDAEKTAKNAGRNRIHLFETTVEWPNFAQVKHLAEEFKQGLQNGNISSALAYKLFDVHRIWSGAADPEVRQAGIDNIWEGDHFGPQARAMRYKPMLGYALRNREEIKPLLKNLHNHDHPDIQTLRVWVSWALYQVRGSKN